MTVCVEERALHSGPRRPCFINRTSFAMRPKSHHVQLPISAGLRRKSISSTGVRSPTYLSTCRINTYSASTESSWFAVSASVLSAGGSESRLFHREHEVCKPVRHDHGPKTVAARIRSRSPDSKHSARRRIGRSTLPKQRIYSLVASPALDRCGVRRRTCFVHRSSAASPVRSFNRHTGILMQPRVFSRVKERAVRH